MINRNSEGRFVKGHKLPKNSIEKMKSNLKGRIPWNKGKQGIMPVPWNKGKTKKKTSICLYCGNNFSYLDSESSGKFCSHKCYTDNRVGKKLTDEHCFSISKGREGIKFSKEHRKNMARAFTGREYLNKKGKTYEEIYGVEIAQKIKEQISKNRKGKMLGGSHPRFTGYSILDKLIRGMPEYKQWREQVFERDNYTCQECGQRGCYLEAHHLKQFKAILEINSIKSIIDARECEDLWELENGQTLCQSCHNLTKGCVRTKK